MLGVQEDLEMTNDLFLAYLTTRLDAIFIVAGIAFITTFVTMFFGTIWYEGRFYGSSVIKYIFFISLFVLVFVPSTEDMLTIIAMVQK